MNRIDMEVSGGCQCGAVRYHATEMHDNAHLCHCRMCQKAVGNIFAALVAAPDDAIAWTRGQPAVWRSSEHVERGFCANCGTPLFYHDVHNGRTNFTIGSLDTPGAFPPGGHTGTEGKMPWFETITAIEDGGATEAGHEAWAAAIRASNHQHPDRDTDAWSPTPRQR
ncbi:GFA family protein [Pelagibacterium lacus]|uniref:GFA family protein n=1 Tax=Pelagibacterium lacus TaxID=2282655 RepID=A0A369W2P4_9HYPH|nr:GFA family protein [Pelagibacterium lacus]RDE08309.1 GFA family protein [Pelagibacterium lacus]